MTTSAVIAGVPNIGGYRSGWDFAAWLGLVQRQTSRIGKGRLGRSTKISNQTIRRRMGHLTVMPGRHSTAL